MFFNHRVYRGGAESTEVFFTAEVAEETRRAQRIFNRRVRVVSAEFAEFFYHRVYRGGTEGIEFFTAEVAEEAQRARRVFYHKVHRGGTEARRFFNRRGLNCYKQKKRPLR